MIICNPYKTLLPDAVHLWNFLDNTTGEQSCAKLLEALELECLIAPLKSVMAGQLGHRKLRQEHLIRAFSYTKTYINVWVETHESSRLQ